MSPRPIIVTLCAALLAWCAPPAAETRPDRPHATWREGPVRYIITSEEDREFKQLASDETRARFIERFWARRDPDTRTLLNEYRFEFWKRVATANRLFADSAKPGWKTDMGRVFVLLGPPDDRDTANELAPGLGRTGVRGTIVWIYSHAPTPRLGTGLRIVFTKDPSGEFRIETDPAIVQRVLSGALTGPRADPTALSLSLPQLPPHLSELQLMLDLGRLDEVPSEEDLLTTIVTAEEFYGAIPFSARYDFFSAHDGQSTIVALTLNVHPDPFDPERRAAPPDYLLVGRIDRETDGRSTAHEPFFLREGDFSPSSINTDPRYHGPYIYQAVAVLPPGRYRVSFAAFDRVARKTGTLSDVLEIPAFPTDTLGLSSLCLSENITPVAAGEEGRVPYVIGQLKVTPRLIPAYHNGDTFAVYYQVYSALADPATRSPALSIEYQFFVSQTGAYVPIGRPIRFDSVGNSAQGWSFPLRDWPSADFKLRVTVTDTLTGQTASREVAFKVL